MSSRLNDSKTLRVPDHRGRSKSAGARCWRFQVRRLRAAAGEHRIDIYHYRSRYKKEANPAPPTRSDDGLLRLAEEPRWPGLGGRSGSILSKMIRRGIPEPGMVPDLLGAMFIVGDRRQAYALERKLVPALGGTVKCLIKLINGIETEKARELVKIVKGMNLKVQAAIEGEKLRVSGKNRDDLQTVIRNLRGTEFPVELQFNNFRD